MRYEDMKVAQLKEIADARGIELPEKAKKADIIIALEEGDSGAQSVKAEVIEDQNGLEVSLVPGKLHANFAVLDKRIDDILATYEGWEPTGESTEELKEVTRSRKYLNSLAKELDERRKEIKREYLRPLDELEGMFNARRDRIKAVSARLQAVEAEADEAYKAEKKAELQEHYEAAAGLLADVVPYDRVADPKWLNKTVNIVAAKKELEEKCRKIAADWETLKGLNLAFADEAELRFFETLDLGDATSYATKLAEDKARLEAMKAEREAYMQPAPAPESVMQPVPYSEPQPVMEPVPIVEPEPYETSGESCGLPPVMVPDDSERRALLIQQIVAALDGYQTWQLERLAEVLSMQWRGGETRPRVMVMDAASVAQMNAIGKVCGIFGVTGEIKSGTLDEVYARTKQAI